MHLLMNNLMNKFVKLAFHRATNLSFLLNISLCSISKKHLQSLYSNCDNNISYNIFSLLVMNKVIFFTISHSFVNSCVFLKTK